MLLDGGNVPFTHADIVRGRCYVSISRGVVWEDISRWFDGIVAQTRDDELLTVTAFMSGEPAQQLFSEPWNRKKNDDLEHIRRKIDEWVLKIDVLLVSRRLHSCVHILVMRA